MSNVSVPDVGLRPAGARFAMGLAVALLGLFGFSQYLLFPLLISNIQEQYSVSVADASLAFTISALTGGTAGILMPRLADFVGDRMVMLIAGIFLTIGALIPAISLSYPALLVGVALMGFGGVAQVLGYALLRRNLKGGISSATVIMTVAAAVGTGVGLVSAGIILELLALPISALFLIYTVIFAVLTVLVFVLSPREAPGERGTLGVGSAVLLIIGFVALLYGLTQASAWGWTDWRVLLLVVGGIVVIALWSRINRRAKHPLVDVSLLLDGRILRVALSAIAFGIGFGVMLFIIPLFAQMPVDVGGLGLSVLGSGLVFVGYSIAMVIGSLVSGPIIARQRPMPVLAAALGLYGLSLLFAASFHAEVWQLVLAVTFSGLAQGAAFTAMYGSLQEAVSAERAGMAGSIGNVTTTIGQAFIVPVIIAILAANTNIDGLIDPTAYTITLSMGGVVLIVGGLISITRKRVTVISAVSTTNE